MFEVVCGLFVDIVELLLLNDKGIFSKSSYALVLGANAGLPDCVHRFQPGWTCDNGIERKRVCTLYTRR